MLQRFLSELLLTVVQMSLVAGFAGLVVMMLRRSVGKFLPQTFSYALWIIVLYRMIFPFSFSSVFSAWGMTVSSRKGYASLFDVVSLKVPLHLSEDSVQDSGQASVIGAFGKGDGTEIANFPGITSGAAELNEMHLSPAAAPVNSVVLVLTAIWILGILALLIYQGVSYWRLCRSMDTAVLFDGVEQVAEYKKLIGLKRHMRVYVSEKAESPFVYGMLQPKVVLPVSVCRDTGVEGDEQRKHILLHEFYHIKRGDCLIKSIAFLALCVHWFNPVLWVAFRTFDKDMEMSCDEGVVNVLQTEEKANYASTLLQFVSEANGTNPKGVLAFRESHVGERVRHIIKHKKAGIMAGALSIVILFTCGVTLLSNPISFGKELRDGRANLLVIGRAEEADQPDTFLLLGYHAERKGINAAFIPRDLMVDEQEIGLARKLSGYAGIHRPEEIVEMANRVLGVDIHHYVIVDTSVLRDLVDVVGGVEFYVPMTMKYSDPYQHLSIDLQKGQQKLNGKQAEMLIRFRKGYAEGDLDRIRMQTAFLEAMVEQKADLKLRPDKILQLLSGRVETDLEAKTVKALIALFGEVQRSGEGIVFLEIPTVVDAEKVQTEHMWVLSLTPEAEVLLQENFL